MTHRFVDTSAWYAVLDRSDRNHQRATALLNIDAPQVMTDHVLAETSRLAAHRLGEGKQQGARRRQTWLMSIRAHSATEPAIDG